MTKALHLEAKHALYAAIASLVIMTIILFTKTKWMMFFGIFISFSLGCFAIFYSLKSMKLISKEEEHYRGNNMAWTAFILGILITLSTLPFLIEFIASIS